MKKLFRKIKEFAKDGLFHIFGGSVVSKISGTLSTFIVIRQLDKISYGEYVSANNLFSYLTSFVGLGLANAALQYCSEKNSAKKKNGIHAYSIGIGSISNFLLVNGRYNRSQIFGIYVRASFCNLSPYLFPNSASNRSS